MKKASLVVVFMAATLGLILGLGLLGQASRLGPSETVTASTRQVCKEAVGWGCFPYLTQADGETLLDLIKCENHGLRRGAIHTLGERGVVSAVGPIIKGLQSRDHHTRRVSALALGKIGHPSAVGPLLEALNNELEFTSVRSSAAWALGRMHDYSSIPALQDISAKAKGELKTISLAALEHLQIRFEYE